MSLVPNQSYANENTPLFVPYTDVSGSGYPLNPTFNTINLSNPGTAGGFDTTSVGMDGNVTFVTVDNTNCSTFATGKMYVFNTGIPPDGAGQGSMVLLGGNAMSIQWAAPGGVTTPFMSGSNSFTLSNLAGVAGNLNVTGAVSATSDISGVNVFASGNLSGVGPVPTSTITSSKSLNPVPVSPTAASPFGVDTNVPTISNATYDVQARGVLAAVGGSPDVNDIVNIAIDAGSGTSIWTYQFKPSAVGDNGNWSIRDRITANAATATIFLTAQVLRAGASTANYSASLIQMDVVRVK
jgi:hypothetical protein